MEVIEHLHDAIRLSATSYINVGVAGHVEISNTWYDEFNQPSRIELLENWINVLSAQVDMEKATYEAKGGLRRWK